MKEILLLLSMVFFHIVDDYYLQSILAQMKQKNWWEKNYPNKMYEKDYIIALLEHAFSWTYMIHIPVVVYCASNYTSLNIPLFILIFAINFSTHMLVDNAKCNLYKLNLVQDQLIHIIQICITWLIYINF